MRRLIDGPRRDWLTFDQVCEYLGVSETHFRDMLHAGVFPAPVELGGKGRLSRWNWLDITAYMHLKSRGLAALSPRPADSGAESAAGEATGKRRRE